jgi:leucyl aminopeptidase
MEFLWAAHLDKRKAADLLVLPFWKGKKKGEWAINYPLASFQLETALATGDFKGKEGETFYFYLDSQPEKRVVLLGLGEKEKLTLESLRRAYGVLIKTCLGKKLKSLNLVVPQDTSLVNDSLIKGIAEGLLLSNYIFDKLKKNNPEEDNESTLVQKVTWISSDKETLKTAQKAQVICEAVYFARDLVNGNADDVTPQYLANCAKTLSKTYPTIKTTVFDKKQIEKEKMGLLLAVNRGSARDPVFIIMQYQGNPKSKDHTVIVGKGITYDTGGLNIKTSGMESMKCDMAGGAVCFGAIIAASQLELKVNLTVVIPSTENCVDANSFKPGDVYTSYLGKTVEMTNSDAEGRLILADGLAYACQHLHPTRLFDFATLTGAIEVALGPEASGLMCNQDELAEEIKQAGEVTSERVWRMPLYEEYKDKLKSDIADLKSWNGRSASSCVAATFLHAFVSKEIPWAHFDIASTAYTTEPKKYQTKYATGVGVRLIVEFLENLK